MKNRIYGYARVSSADQNLDRQLDALERFPVQTNLIYADKASGKDFRRPQYQRLLRRLREGDVLVIKSIDRLGRDYREVLDEWRRLTTDKRVAIVVPGGGYRVGASAGCEIWETDARTSG